MGGWKWCQRKIIFLNFKSCTVHCDGRLNVHHMHECLKTQLSFIHMIPWFNIPGEREGGEQREGESRPCKDDYTIFSPPLSPRCSKSLKATSNKGTDLNCVLAKTKVNPVLWQSEPSVRSKTHRRSCAVVGPELGFPHEGFVPWSSPWGASTCSAPSTVGTNPDRSAAAPAFLLLQKQHCLFHLLLLYAFHFSPSPCPSFFQSP